MATSLQLTEHHLQLLRKGLTFIPTSTILSDQRQSMKAHIQLYHRRLKLASYYGPTRNITIPPFQPPSTWEPKNNQLPTELLSLFNQDKKDLTRVQVPKETPNLTDQENKALEELRALTNVVIKPADKGSAVVIMDLKDYVWEANRQLQDTTYYQRLETPIYPETATKIQAIIDRMVSNKILSKKQALYLKGKTPPRPRYFYLLPKIHKKPDSWSTPHKIPPGRPIISDCDSESYGSAELIDHFLNPLSTQHASYVKDTNDFVRRVRELTLPPTCFLFTMDVESLYTNIDTQKGLEAIRKIFNQNPDPTRPDQDLLELLQINLTCNDFQFNGQNFLQVKGTAMGKRFSPSYANIYMAEWETAALRKSTLKPLIYLRYLDDIWGIWTHTKEEFDTFLTILNQHHTSIRLSATISDTEVHFLDTTVFKGPDFDSMGKLSTRVYFKPTDSHSLLHRSSFHPKHTFRGIIHSQLLRFQRICSNDQDRNEASKTLFQALRQRGYSRTFLRNIRKKTFQDKNTPNPPREDKPIIPLISTFSSFSVQVHRRLKRNFQNTLPEDILRNQYKLISAFKKNPNLKDLLVRAKLPKVSQGTLTTMDRGPRVISNRKDNTHFLAQKGLNLSSENAIYCIRCQHCGKQYVGETGNTIRTRLHSHSSNIRNNRKRNTPLVRHFREHGLHNLRIYPLECKAGWTHRNRLREEERWIDRLGTRFPHGLNEA